MTDTKATPKEGSVCARKLGGDFIKDLKRVRDEFGTSLREAKDLMDRFGCYEACRDYLAAGGIVESDRTKIERLERELAEANVCERENFQRAEHNLARAEAAERALSDAVRWIPVSERLPEVDTFVLAHWRDVAWTGIAKFDPSGEWLRMEIDEGEVVDADPSHWMPLPEAPK